MREEQMKEVQEQLTRLHEDFLKRLAHVADPPSDLARCRVYGRNFTRDPDAPNAQTNGIDRLAFKIDKGRLDYVPRLEDSLDSSKICSNLIKKYAYDLDGPQMINFRYDYVDGDWTGGFAVQSSREHGEEEEARAPLDERFRELMKRAWRKDLKGLTFFYGASGATNDPGPRLQYELRPKGFETVKCEGAFVELWQEYVRHFEAFGHPHVYRAQVFVKGPSARPMNMDIDYGL